MRMQSSRFIKIIIALIILLTPLYAYSDDPLTRPEIREYVIRTAMLKQLTLFVEWPTSTEEYRSICIYDPNKNFYNANAIYKDNQSSKNAKILYLNGYTQHETYGCNIIYFDVGEITRFKGVLDIANKYKIFLVGSNSDFLYQGGMASLVEDNGTIQIELNLSSINDVGLKISPSLIEVSRRVLN